MFVLHSEPDNMCNHALYIKEDMDELPSTRIFTAIHKLYSSSEK